VRCPAIAARSLLAPTAARGARRLSRANRRWAGGQQFADDPLDRGVQLGVDLVH